MMRGLFRLTWLEIKIFVREPLGLLGTVGIPVLVFVLLGRLHGVATPVNAGLQRLARHLAGSGAAPGSMAAADVEDWLS